MLPEDVVRAYLAAVERKDADALDALLDDSVALVEHPSRFSPQGRRRDKADMLRGLEQGRSLLRHEAYEIVSLIADGPQVAVQLRWRGELAIALGELAPGDVLTANIAQFLAVRGDRIVAGDTYDCIDP